MWSKFACEHGGFLQSQSHILFATNSKKALLTASYVHTCTANVRNSNNAIANSSKYFMCIKLKA